MNLAIKEFQQTLIDVINKAELPIEVKRLIVNDLAREINVVADAEIKKELEERNKVEEGKEDGVSEN